MKYYQVDIILTVDLSSSGLLHTYLIQIRCLVLEHTRSHRLTSPPALSEAERGAGFLPQR
jgi:hypothetical protein